MTWQQTTVTNSASGRTAATIVTGSVCAAIAAAAMWLGVGQISGHGTRHAVVASHVPAPAAASASASHSTSARTSAATLSRPKAIGPTVYLVSSPQQQAAAEAQLMDAEPLRQSTTSTGQPESHVVVATGDSAEQRRLIAEENQTRDGLGLPEITLVDLRAAQ